MTQNQVGCQTVGCRVNHRQGKNKKQRKRQNPNTAIVGKKKKSKER